MKSIVIIFCVLLFCSKFVVSIPFAEESVQQRAYQSNNWQGNQNIGEHYHGNSFAQPQSLNSMISPPQQYDHSHEHVSQGRQNFENYGFNNNPVLQQSPPVKNSQVFANERKLDGYQARPDSFQIRQDNNPVRVENQQYRQNNWQAQNRFVNSAASASASAVSIAERPAIPVREPYRGPGQHTHYIPPAENQRQTNQGDKINPVMRGTHYHGVAERPTNIRYMNANGPESNNRHAHYENYNEGNAPAMNSNAAQSGSDGFIENTALYSAPTNSQPPERYSGSPALGPDRLNNVGSYQMQYGPRSPNVPNTFNRGRPTLSNTGGNHGNRPMNQPAAINPGFNNQVPSVYEIPNTASQLENKGHNRYVENGPRFPSAVNNHKHVQKPAFNNNKGSNIYNRPIVPNGVDFDKTEVNNPLLDSERNYQPPANPVKEPQSAPLDIIVISEESPSDAKHVVPKEGNRDEIPIAPNDVRVTGDRKPVESQPVIETTPEREEANSNKNIYNHFSSGPDRGYMGNVLKDPKYKDLFKKKSSYMVIHLNGTVEHVNDMDKIPQDDPNYIIVKKNDRSSNADEYKTPPLLPKVPKEKDSNQPPESVHPAHKRRPSTIAPLPLADKPYYLPSDSQPPNSDEYYPSYSSIENNQPQVTSSPIDDEYKSPPVQHAPHKFKLPSEVLYGHRYPKHNKTVDYVPPLTTPASDDELLQKFLDSLSNKTDNKQPLNPSDKGSTKPKPNIPSSDSNENPDWVESPTKSPSKLHTHISPGIFTKTTPYESYTKPPSKLHTVISPGIITKTTPYESSTKPPSKLHTVISPGIITKTTPYASSSKPPSKLHTHISPGIYKSTTPSPSDDILDSLDSESGEVNKQTTTHSVSSTDSDRIKPGSKPLITHDRQNKKPIHVPLHISPGIYKSTTQKPIDDISDTSNSDSADINKKPIPHPVNSTDSKKPLITHDHQNTGPIHLPLHKSPTIQKPSDDISDVSDNNNDAANKTSTPEPYDEEDHDSKKHSINKKPLLIHPKDKDDKNPLPVPEDADIDSEETIFTSLPKDKKYKKPLHKTSSPSDDTNSEPDSLVLIDRDEVYDSTPKKDHKTSEKVHSSPSKSNDTSDEDEPNNPSEHNQYPHSLPVSKKNKTTPKPKSKPLASATTPTVDLTTADTIITISPIELVTENVKDGANPDDTDVTVHDKKGAKKSSTPKESDKDKKTTKSEDKKDDKPKSNTESAANISLENTEVDTPNDNSAIETISAVQTDVNTDDHSASDGNLLKPKSNTSDMTIVLTIPTYSDDTVTIKVEVPDSTGFQDTSGDDTLVVSINKKNCTKTDTAKSTNIDQDWRLDGDSENSKNFVIDFSNSTVLWNSTSDKDYFNEIVDNATVAVIYVFQIQPQPVIERNKVTTIFANNTVIEEIKETTWQNNEPKVTETKKIYTQGANN